MPDRGQVDWDGLIADYGRIRDKIEAVIPGFENYNARIKTPDGFHLPIAGRERKWDTDTGKANFLFAPDMRNLKLTEGDWIEFTTAAEDGIDRRASGFKVVAYDVP